mgnify:CR=1 FL=1
MNTHSLMQEAFIAFMAETSPREFTPEAFLRWYGKEMPFVVKLIGEEVILAFAVERCEFMARETWPLPASGG